MVQRQELAHLCAALAGAVIFLCVALTSASTNVITQEITVGQTPAAVGVSQGRACLLIKPNGGAIECGPCDQSETTYFPIADGERHVVGLLYKGQLTADQEYCCFASSDTTVNIHEEGAQPDLTATPTHTPTP